MPLYNNYLHKILFLDIETVSQKQDFGDLDTQWQELWAQKTEFQRRTSEIEPADFYEDRAAIMAEFGKIVCISCGYFVEKDGRRSFRLKSFYRKEEKDLLEDFAQTLNTYFEDWFLCAHNGKEFDFPYLARRMMVHNIKLPKPLNISGLKPWEVAHLDTMDMWKFGDYKNFTSLKLLAALFDIPSPKEDIDGSQVGEVYWKEKDLARIVEYCQRDVVTLARVYLKMERLPYLNDDEVIINE